MNSVVSSFGWWKERMHRHKLPGGCLACWKQKVERKIGAIQMHGRTLLLINDGVYCGGAVAAQREERGAMTEVADEDENRPRIGGQGR
ncbi:unnamed protein product [Linum trigynum]|uniref:Uncharacterized protein n=1 Tax=Linum trigynum TaxID=586398 RepID=A0AAV2EPS4_9ROSI